MKATTPLIDSLDALLSSAPSAVSSDEFQALEVRIPQLDQGRPVLARLLADVRADVLAYDSAAAWLAPAAEGGSAVPHSLRRAEEDVVLQAEVLRWDCLCARHRAAYQQALQEQEDEFAFPPWARYALLEGMARCPSCDLRAWVQVVLDKGDLERCLRERLAADLPALAGRLAGLRLLYWADLASLEARIAARPLEVYRALAAWGAPCLLICHRNARNGGSDYLRSLSAADCRSQAAVEAALGPLLAAPALLALIRSRQGRITEYPSEAGYLPPEYWLSASLLAQAQVGEPLPGWFAPLAPLFAYALLATVSSRVSVDGEQARFQIEREFALTLCCSFSGAGVTLLGEGGAQTVPFTPELLQALLRLYAVALQAKYTAINQDLVQKAIVYGTGFDYRAFFARLESIAHFYAFEHQHLLGDRFEQQSRTLSALIGDMVGLRQRLAALVDSLSRDLSELTIAVLATTALAVVARVMDIQNVSNLITYGLLTAPIFLYLYLTVFLMRIDNLRRLGERAVDEFTKDLALGQQIWDYPLHQIGVSEADLDRATLLEPLLHQHRVDGRVAQITGIVVHLLLMGLALARSLWWLPAAKLALDSALFGWAFWHRAHPESRVVYHLVVWAVTVAAVALAYWMS